jgi:hypothetical protein
MKLTLTGLLRFELAGDGTRPSSAITAIPLEEKRIAEVTNGSRN